MVCLSQFPGNQTSGCVCYEGCVCWVCNRFLFQFCLKLGNICVDIRLRMKPKFGYLCFNLMPSTPF